MEPKLGAVQRIQYNLYLDCKERTKKKNPFGAGRNDEILIRTILANSSILEQGTERAFQEVRDAVHLICKQLCPGTWCTRSHCKHHNRGSAFYCTKTRPKVCKEYKKYIEKKKERDNATPKR